MQTLSRPTAITRRALRIPLDGLELWGELALQSDPRGLVVFLNGDGDHLYDRMNGDVARRLRDAGFATLIVDLLTPGEAIEDAETSALRLDQSFLASRIVKLTRWARRLPVFCELRIGFLATGLYAGAVLAAAAVSSHIGSVVCCVPAADLEVPRLSRLCADALVLPGERDLLANPRVVERVALEAEWWFGRSLSRKRPQRRDADVLVETA